MAEKQKNKKWIVALVVILAAAVVVMGVLLAAGTLEREPKAQRDLEAQMGLLPNKTEDEIQALLDQVVAEGMFNISCNTNMTLADGKLNVQIENVPGNKYLMQVDVVLSGGETIYSSGLIEPGYYIEQAECTAHLSPGRQDATAIFTAFDPETEDNMGKSAIEITVNAP